jgi:UrcA family protein
MKLATGYAAIAAMMTLAPVALTLTPAKAHATEDVIRSVNVSYADLDLRSSAGQRAMQQRIRIAIDRVCGPALNTDLAGANEIRRCRSELKERVAGMMDQIARRDAMAQRRQITLRY